MKGKGLLKKSQVTFLKSLYWPSKCTSLYLSQPPSLTQHFFTINSTWGGASYLGTLFLNHIFPFIRHQYTYARVYIYIYISLSFSFFSKKKKLGTVNIVELVFYVNWRPILSFGLLTTNINIEDEARLMRTTYKIISMSSCNLCGHTVCMQF